jgi:GNAT superfamily N-acetyltransferase
MASTITLRPLDAQDGANIAALGEQTPDTGAVAFHNTFHSDPYASIRALYPNMTGVVAEASDHDGIVGLGMMSLGQCQYEGDVCPYAYLFSLSVHPAYRRRGIAAQIAAWRVETARKLLGEETVIFAGIQQGNEGSLRNAAKWSTQRLDGRNDAAVVKMRATAPGARAGLTVRTAEKDEYEEIAHKQDAFYCGYNLYPIRSAEELYDWHRAAPFAVPLRDYYVVVDQRGNLLAGLSATSEGKVTSGHVVRMAWLLRLLNSILQIIPPSGMMERIQVKDLWFEPGQMEAGRYLWESVRWLLHDEGTTMMSFFDAHSVLAQVMRMPRYMPPQRGTLVFAAPTPLDETKCIYMQI